MKTYIQAKHYLDSFINYEKKSFFPYKKSLKLKRVEVLLKGLGTPYQKLRCLHIAGTKGKGSTAHFCATLLAYCGFKVGLYTSPHFFDFRERISVLNVKGGNLRNKIIPKKEVARILGKFTPYLKRVKPDKKSDALSFFEVYTAVAFEYFWEKRLDFVVLETGLGGRLDATNVVTPLVSIITHIGYDHMDKLGNTLQKIAYEKAGIIKPGIPVISCAQDRKSVV